MSALKGVEPGDSHDKTKGTAMQEQYFDLIWDTGAAMMAGNWPELRALLPTTISVVCDAVVAPEMEPTKRETVRYFRGLLMMTDAELEAARVAS